MRRAVLAVLLGLGLVPTLRAAGRIHLLPPDAGLIASSDVRSNALAEGTTRGSMTNYYWNFGPSYGWHRTITQIASNGLFRADYSAFRGEHRAAPRRPDLSVLFFPTPSRGRVLDLAGEVDWEQRLAEQLEVQRHKIHGVKSATLRVPEALWALEEALNSSLFFTANAARYEFTGTNEGFSFAGQLPASFPGALETGGFQARRVRIFLEPHRREGPSLVLEHTPLLLDGYVEAFRFVLAGDVAWFSTSYFDGAAQSWTNAWLATSAPPSRVGLSLLQNSSGQLASRGVELGREAVSPGLQGVLTAGPLEIPPDPPTNHGRARLWPEAVQPHAVELEWLGRSGVELARYILATELDSSAMQFESLNQKWAGGVGDSNSLLAHIPMQDFPLGGGTISLRIVDLERKFNINLVPSAPEILIQALILAGLDGGSALAAADPILDWLDADNTPRMNGAESDYYLGLTPPYAARNGPVDDVAELLHIKGVTPQMFFGPFTNGRPGFPAVGLRDFFTPVSGRFININTASAAVLQLIPDVDGNLAQAIITARAGPDGIPGNEDDIPFRSIGELANVPGMTPQIAQLFSRYFSTRSATYEVTVAVKLGRQKRQYVAWLSGGSNPQILKFYRTE